MIDEREKIINENFSKEELVQIIIEALNEEKKMYRNPFKVNELIVSSLKNKEKRLHDEWYKILEKIATNNNQTMTKEYFDLLKKGKEKQNKIECIDKFYILEERLKEEMRKKYKKGVER